MIERLIYYEKNQNNFFEVTALGGSVRARMYLVFHQMYQDLDDVCVYVPAQQFLMAIAKARQGDSIRIEGNKSGHFLAVSPREIMVSHTGVSNSWPREYNYDALLLDSFSVLENSEHRKRDPRHIEVTVAEQAIIDIVATNPSLIYSFSPREFEVLVGMVLTDIGFSKVRLTPFSRDGGFDLSAVYFEGDKEHTVLVEVKRYSKKKVGLAIVDRLNGVLDREQADKAMIVTSSSFSADAQRYYSFHCSKMALIDYRTLEELLDRSSGQWHVTPFGLWTLNTVTETFAE